MWLHLPLKFVEEFKAMMLLEFTETAVSEVQLTLKTGRMMST